LQQLGSESNVFLDTFILVDMIRICSTVYESVNFCCQTKNELSVNGYVQLAASLAYLLFSPAFLYCKYTVQES